jgi:hypothetical protein
MKKLFLSMMLLAIPLLANSFAVENADGITIYYDYVNNGTELVVVGAQQVAVVNIPEEVNYMGRTRKVTCIDNFAFESRRELTSVTIPNSVVIIGSYAFYGCSGLTSVTIGSSVISFGNSAFEGCSGLTSVHITDLEAWCKISFINWSQNPLFYAHHLYLNGEEIKDLVIPNSVTSIGSYAFSGCDGLTSVNIGNSVTSIGGYAFSGCDGLTSVTIRNSVTSIGDQTFSYCSGLTSVSIGNSVTNIGKGAFSYCNSLNSVISNMEIPCSIDKECFPDDVFYNVTLYVPNGTTDKYRSTPSWNKFLYIEEGEPGSTQPEEKKCATPTISYANKELTFSCETEGVEFVSKITDADIKDF